MKPERRWLAMIAALLALVGCTLTQTDRRKDADSKAIVIGGSGAGSMAAKQAALVIRIASRPVDDEALGSAIWDAADEQLIPTAVRDILEANGLRIGVLTGELPKKLRAVLDAPPPKRVDSMTVVLPDNESTIVELAAVPKLNLRFDRTGQGVASKSYEDLHGFFRLTVRLDDTAGVGLRLTPELHHGPIQRNWTPAPTIGSMAPMQFVIRDGQQEETLSDLKAEVVIRPGQLVVVSGRTGAAGGLGDLLFGGVEPNSDRGVRRALFISATRSDTSSSPGPRATPPRLEPVDTVDQPANPPERPSVR